MYAYVCIYLCADVWPLSKSINDLKGVFSTMVSLYTQNPELSLAHNR
jgi:hypothetical protein